MRFLLSLSKENMVVIANPPYWSLRPRFSLANHFRMQKTFPLHNIRRLGLQAGALKGGAEQSRLLQIHSRVILTLLYVRRHSTYNILCLNLEQVCIFAVFSSGHYLQGSIYCKNFKQKIVRDSSSWSFKEKNIYIVFFPEGVEFGLVDHLASKVATALYLTNIWTLPSFPEHHRGKSQELFVFRTLKK